MQIEIPPARSVMDVFDETVRRNGSSPALCFKNGGSWSTIDWNGYRDAVRAAARGDLPRPANGARTSAAANRAAFTLGNSFSSTSLSCSIQAKIPESSPASGAAPGL